MSVVEVHRIYKPQEGSSHVFVYMGMLNPYMSTCTKCTPKIGAYCHYMSTYSKDPPDFGPNCRYISTSTMCPPIFFSKYHYMSAYFFERTITIIMPAYKNLITINRRCKGHYLVFNQYKRQHPTFTS